MLHSYSEFDPKQIIVRRDNRQRRENISDVEDLKASIKSIGIINPIVVRDDGDEIVLVAGERRLIASLALGLEVVPIRNFADLSEEEAEIVELEENVKRKELTWRDQVRAVGRIHLLYRKNHMGWKIEQTAEAISLHHSHVRKILHVFDALDSGRVDRAETIEQAYNTLHRFSERKAESIVGDIIVQGAALFGSVAPVPTTVVNTVSDSFTTTTAVKLVGEGVNGTPAPIAPVPLDPIICANFHDFAKAYNGPKFSLIHCDFPYGNYKGGDHVVAMAGQAHDTEDFYDNSVDIYWNLLESLTSNLDRLMSYSAHLVFWFNMNFYTETVQRLRKTGLFVHDHPLIWHKTGGPGGIGVVPGTAVTYPRRTYDTALLAVRGNRPLVKSSYNSYAAPTVGKKLHPSQKPEPMLRFFLSMVVDETTTMLDPTAGSGAALRAAEDLGAKSILGLELDSNYATIANTKTLQARILRQAGNLRKDDGDSMELI